MEVVVVDDVQSCERIAHIYFYVDRSGLILFGHWNDKATEYTLKVYILQRSIVKPTQPPTVSAFGETVWVMCCRVDQQQRRRQVADEAVVQAC